MLTTPAQLAAEFVAACNAHDPDRLAALHAADYEGLDVAQVTPLRGLESVRQVGASYLRAFPDLSLTVDRTVVDRQLAALFWTAHGTHRGPFLHIPPTGRLVVVRGSSLLTVQECQIAKSLHIWDVAGLLRALGLLPDL